MKNAPANGKAVRRLESFKRLLAHVREILSLNFGFVVWDGSSVPADLPSHALAIVFADEGVVAAMQRRPNADTFLNLWVTSRIDIRNGVIFDLVARRPGLRPKEDPRAYQRTSGADDGTEISVRSPRRAVATRSHTQLHSAQEWERTDQQGQCSLPLRSLQRVLCPLPRSRDGLQLRLFHRLGQRFSDSPARQARHDLPQAAPKARRKTARHWLRLGALVCHAARHYGVDAVGVTLAEEQFAYAKDKVARLGLQNKVTIECSTIR